MPSNPPSTPACAPTLATSAQVPPRLPVSVGLTAFTLALLLGLQPISTDVYLPALPMLTQALGAPMRAAQLTMSALILAFGLAQMVWGPAADRVGRRPVLLLGLACYCAASTGAALAGSIEALVAYAIGRWLGDALDGRVQPLAYGLAFWAALTCAIAWSLVQRAAR